MIAIPQKMMRGEKMMKTSLEVIASITQLPKYSLTMITALMQKLQQNEKGLALLMNVTPMTVRLWTSGVAQPCGQSQRLMQIYDACPEIVDYILEGSEKEA